MTDDISDSDCLLIAIEGVLRKGVPANLRKADIHHQYQSLLSYHLSASNRQGNNHAFEKDDRHQSRHISSKSPTAA